MQCLCKNLNPFKLQFTFTLIPLNKITFPSALTSLYLQVTRGVNTLVRRCISAKDTSKPHAPNGHFVPKAPELPVTLGIFFTSVNLSTVKPESKHVHPQFRSGTNLSNSRFNAPT